jgi:hypothetical protein
MRSDVGGCFSELGSTAVQSFISDRREGKKETISQDRHRTINNKLSRTKGSPSSIHW